MTLRLRQTLQQERAADLADRVRRLLGPFTGTEAALDSGCGTGAPDNVRFVEGDATALPFEYGEFDIAACLRVLHHIRRPELAVSELARVARSGGRVFIADQLGSVDPLRSLEMDRFERLRDDSHQRLLPDADIRGYLDANDLVLVSSEVTRERVDLERRLELAELPEEERVKIRGSAPAAPYDVEIGWYVARKSGP